MFLSICNHHYTIWAKNKVSCYLLLSLGPLLFCCSMDPSLYPKWPLLCLHRKGVAHKIKWTQLQELRQQAGKLFRIWKQIFPFMWTFPYHCFCKLFRKKCLKVLLKTRRQCNTLKNKISQLLCLHVGK